MIFPGAPDDTHYSCETVRRHVLRSEAVANLYASGAPREEADAAYLGLLEAVMADIAQDRLLDEHRMREIAGAMVAPRLARHATGRIPT